MAHDEACIAWLVATENMQFAGIESVSGLEPLRMLEDTSRRAQSIQL